MHPMSAWYLGIREEKTAFTWPWEERDPYQDTKRGLIAGGLAGGGLGAAGGAVMGLERGAERGIRSALKGGSPLKGLAKVIGGGLGGVGLGALTGGAVAGGLGAGLGGLYGGYRDYEEQKEASAASKFMQRVGPYGLAAAAGGAGLVGLGAAEGEPVAEQYWESQKPGLKGLLYSGPDPFEDTPISTTGASLAGVGGLASAPWLSKLLAKKFS